MEDKPYDWDWTYVCHDLASDSPSTAVPSSTGASNSPSTAPSPVPSTAPSSTSASNSPTGEPSSLCDCDDNIIIPATPEPTLPLPMDVTMPPLPFKPPVITITISEPEIPEYTIAEPVVTISKPEIPKLTIPEPDFTISEPEIPEYTIAEPETPVLTIAEPEPPVYDAKGTAGTFATVGGVLTLGALAFLCAGN